MPDFFADPILNSPYDAPTRHWELDDAGHPTGRIVASRRRAEFVAGDGPLEIGLVPPR